MVACPKDYLLSNIIDDLATFFEQLAETRDAVLKKREIQEQLRKTEEAQKVMKQQLQRTRMAPKNQEKDLFGDFNDLKKLQMTSRAPPTARGKPLPPLGTMHQRPLVHVDSTGVTLSPRHSRVGRNTGFDINNPRDVSLKGVDSTIKMPANQRMETIKNGQASRPRVSGMFANDGTNSGQRDSILEPQGIDRLPKGFGIIDPLPNFISPGASPKIGPVKRGENRSV